MPEISPVPESQIPRPEYVSNKAPQPLARNFEQRVDQLQRISANPTEEQIAKLGTTFFTEGVDKTGDPKENARNAFDNMRSLIQDRKAAEEGVRQARKEALGASKDQFSSKVEVLREAEKRRSELNQNLKSFSSIFQDAGITVDPSQQEVGLMDKVNQKAYETGWQMAAGAAKAGEVVTGGIEVVKEKGKGLIEAGREGLANLFDSGKESLNQAQENGKATFNNVKSKAENAKGKTESGLSRLGGLLRNTKEAVGRKIGEVYDASSVWVNQRRAEIATKLGQARENAGERIDNFIRPMKEMGEAAKNKMDEAGQALHNFGTEQAARIDNIRKAIGERVGGEISLGLAKAKIFLEPAWESVQRDRESLRENRAVMMEKLGIMVEGVSDLASPIIDKILDRGRDARDGALGFSNKATEGLRVFGRNALNTVSESPAWKFMQERWESLRLQSNESRDRLNTFLNGTLGRVGERFKPLTEAVAARAKRTAAYLSGVRIENGYIVHGDGIRVSDEVSEWFMQQGSSAKEFLNRGKEKASDGLDMLNRYWEIYAVGKWSESGMSGVDVQRRLKMLRGIGAASLGRVASVSAAAGMEGASMVARLAKDRKGQVALTVAAAALALALSPEIRDNLQQLLNGVDFGGLQLPASTPDIDISSVPTVTPDLNIGPEIQTSVPTPDVLSNVVSTVPDIASAIQSPETLINSLIPGQPLEAQARQLAGGVNETYYQLLQDGFDQFKGNFLTTAQTIVNNSANYTPEQLSLAQDQLQAAARLDQDPSLIKGTQAWYDTIMKAAHFWRPV